MALKIVKQDEPIVTKSIITVLYGPPGSGKTTLANSCRKPLLLDFDGGVVRSEGRQDTIQINRWQDVEAITRADVEGYETVIVDTGGTMLDVLTQFIIETDPKAGRGGSLSQQGFGQLKQRATAFMKMLTSWGLQVVVICHSKEEKSGDDTKQRLVMTGSSVQDVMRSAEMIGFVTRGAKTHTIDFSPSENMHTKDSAGVGVVAIPQFKLGTSWTFLGDLIAQSIDGINKRNQAKGEFAKEMDAAIKKSHEAKDVGLMNQVLTILSKSSPEIKKAAFAILNGNAAEIGAVFNKESKLFEAAK